MATGPSLVAIRPNAGDADGYLFAGEQLMEAPTAITLEFSPGQTIDPNSLSSGIQVIRAGLDGTFDPAFAVHDFGTGGGVNLEFTSVRAGDFGNNLTIVVTKRDRGPGGGVGISVSQARLDVELNANFGNETTAEKLVDAINFHPQAASLIHAAVQSGDPARDLTAIANNTTISLGGATTSPWFPATWVWAKPSTMWSFALPRLCPTTNTGLS